MVLINGEFGAIAASDKDIVASHTLCHKVIHKAAVKGLHSRLFTVAKKHFMCIRIFVLLV